MCNFAAQTFEYPLVDGVNTVTGLPSLAELDEQAVEAKLLFLAADVVRSV